MVLVVCVRPQPKPRLLCVGVAAAALRGRTAQLPAPCLGPFLSSQQFLPLGALCVRVAVVVAAVVFDAVVFRPVCAVMWAPVAGSGSLQAPATKAGLQHWLPCRRRVLIL